MITRDETPFTSSIGKGKATAIYHEWQTDTLEAPGNSVIAEGIFKINLYYITIYVYIGYNFRVVNSSKQLIN